MRSWIGGVIFAVFAIGYLLGATSYTEHKIGDNGRQNKYTPKETRISYWRNYFQTQFSQYNRKQRENRHYANPNIL
jgi:hypothetical protein